MPPSAAAPPPSAPAPLPASPTSAVGTRLVVEASEGAGTGPVRATLTCDPPGGDHPDPATACADLRREREPFAPLSAAVACTELYGGPQTARVTGTYAGEPVELELSRTDGCRTAQWDRLGTLLSALVPVGA